MAQETIQTALQNAVEAEHTILDVLTAQQKAALESKYYALPEEVRSSTDAKYPTLPTVGRYIARQIVKEANGKLASIKRPEWYSRLNREAASLKSDNKEIRGYAEKQLRDLAEELDSKESATLLKKYKTAHDLTSKDAHVVQLCGIFGVSPANLA
jgi:hypothetical protein